MGYRLRKTVLPQVHMCCYSLAGPWNCGWLKLHCTPPLYHPQLTACTNMAVACAPPFPGLAPLQLLGSSDTNEEGPTTFEVGAGDIVGNRLFEVRHAAGERTCESCLFCWQAVLCRKEELQRTAESRERDFGLMLSGIFALLEIKAMSHLSQRHSSLPRPCSFPPGHPASFAGL